MASYFNVIRLMGLQEGGGGGGVALVSLVRHRDDSMLQEDNDKHQNSC